MYIIKKIKGAVRRVRKLFYRTDFEKEIDRWLKDRGDETLRLKYDNLNESSLVLDVGVYKGDFADKLNKIYGCKVLCFEPVDEFYQIAKNRFAGNDKVKVFNFGLGGKTEQVKLAKSNDASSMHKQDSTENYEVIRVEDICSFLKQQSIANVDLIKINIEGAEYDLMERLIEGYDIQKVRDVQIQFHDFFDDAEMRMRKIQTALAKTHKPTYQYKFVWENWTLKQ